MTGRRITQSFGICRYWNGFCESDPILVKSSGIRWKKPTHTQNIFWFFFGALNFFFFNLSCFRRFPAESWTRGYGEKREICPNLQEQFGDATSGAPLDISEWSEICYRSRKWNFSRFWDVLSPWSAKMDDFSCRSGKISLFKSIGFSVFFPKTTRIF